MSKNQYVVRDVLVAGPWIRPKTSESRSVVTPFARRDEFDLVPEDSGIQRSPDGQYPQFRA